jgi:hypothetical protein
MLLAGSMTCLHVLLAMAGLAVYVVGYYNLDKMLLLFFDEKSLLLELSLKGRFVTCCP